MKNIFSGIPAQFQQEIFEEIALAGEFKIERIISRGHSSPRLGWYDQSLNEWVLVLKGRDKILFEEGEEVLLGPGDYLHIPAHTRHKVSWTDPHETTLWLAVHYP